MDRDAHDDEAPIRLAGTRAVTDDRSNDGDSMPLDDDSTPLFADVDDLSDQWTEVQTAFVDDPRGAIERADALVADVMTRVTQRLGAQRELLEGTWRRGEEASTEDLRVAFQHYRAFFQRLLAT